MAAANCVRAHSTLFGEKIPIRSPFSNPNATKAAANSWLLAVNYS